MGKYATDSGGGGGFKPKCGELHRVVCVQLVDFGTHDKEWNGKIVGTANKINIGFEFVDETREGENGNYNPIWGTVETLSTGKKANLRKLLEGWRGKPLTDEEAKKFDVGVLLGLPCNLLIQPNRNGNPKITAIMPCKEKLQPTRELKSFFFDEKFNGELPDWLPEWMQEEITNSEEWTEFHHNHDGEQCDDRPPVRDEDVPADPADEYEDSIPF